MKILIGQSYYRILDPKELKRQMPYPPLGTLYAATILKNYGHEIIFYDGMLGNKTGEFNHLILKTNPDLVLIYDDEFNYLTKMCLSNMREAALSFIKTAKSKKIPVIVYSSDATDFHDYYFNAGCDGIIYGEGEITLQELVEFFNNEEYFEERRNIKGLKFREDEKLVVTPSRKNIDDLDEIPYPDYSFIDIERYREIWLKNHGYFSLNISTTRGCPYKCNWCAKPLYGKIYQSRSAHNVVNQIKYLKENFAIDHLWITDDIFGLKTGWINDFADKLNELNLKIPYKCLSRPDILLRNNTIEHLKNSGCRTIWIGAESGSQKILNAMDKGTTVGQIYDASYKTHQSGMEIAFFIQFGYTGENWADIKSTRKMIKECMPDDIGISVSYPLPDTRFYEKVKEQMEYKTNWKDSDDLDLMFSGSFERSFYKTLHRLVHAEYRIHKFAAAKNIKNIVRIIINYTRFIICRLKLQKYLREENRKVAVTDKKAYHSI